MWPDRLLKLALLSGDILATVIGVAHIFMPSLGYSSIMSSSMTTEIRDHFYYLATYAIGAFLLTLGFLSIYFSRLDYPKASLVVCAALSVLWITRAILEFAYPVEIGIFFMDRPTVVLFPVISTIAAMYSAATVSYAKRGMP